MKQRWMAMAWCCLALVPALAFGQSGRIRTMGQAEVTVPPDTVEVGFSVMTQDKQLTTAREQAARRMTAVLEAVKALKIPGVEIGTTGLSVTPLVKRPEGNQQYAGPGVEFQQEITGYQVVNTASVQVRGEGSALGEHVSRIMDAATTSGATNFTGPSFYRKDLTATHAQALEQATKDAINKAQALARGAGVTIKGFSYVGMFPEEEPGPRPMMMADRAVMSMAAGGGTPTPVEVRDVSVSTQVWVTATY